MLVVRLLACVYPREMKAGDALARIRGLMSTTVDLIPFADFPTSERAAVLAVLQRVGLAASHVCITRLQPSSDVNGLPTVALVSAPGWWRSYEGDDWIPRVERDLSELVRSREGVPQRVAS